MADDGPPAERYGHIKISRKAYEADPFWNEPREFSRWEAWEYMIQAASFKETQWSAGGPIIRLARGETPPLSLSYLCRAWTWSTKKVRVFLDLLISEERVTKGQDTPQGHTYLLVNYDTYQGSGAQLGHSRGTARAQPGQESEAVKQLSMEAENNNPPTPLNPAAREVVRLCEANNAPWKLKVGIEEWVNGLPGDYENVRDFDRHIRECSEWWQNQRKAMNAPDRAIRNWLKKEEEDRRGRRDARGPASQGRGQATGTDGHRSGFVIEE